MLKMTNIKKVFRTEIVETHALRDFSLTVNEGDFVAVTGPSGSGKTTFLNIAGLLETFSSGQYFLDNVDVSNLNDNQRSKLRNEKIGFIFQSFNLIPDLNLFDNVDVPLRYRKMNRQERKERIEHALETVGLAARMKHLPMQLSGGQQQRVAIARALVNRPSIILADEPTGNLDSTTGAEIMAIFDRLHAEGNTILLVTHEESVAGHAHRVIRLRDGIIESDLRIPEAA